MNTVNLKIRQFPLKFKPRTDFGRDDFMAADCNIEALNMVERWPDWPFFAIVLYGPEGCGKSHLAHVFAEHVAACCEPPIPVQIIQATAVNSRKQDESVYIPVNTKHRIQNDTESDVEFIEVQTGDKLDENDIVRFEDIYGRV